MLGLTACSRTGVVLTIGMSLASAQDRVTETPDLSVQALVPELHNARIGAFADIPENRRRNFIPEDNWGWRFEGDFNSDGRADVTFLGLYEENGSRKSFALIATRESGALVRTNVFTFDADFIIGRHYDTGLVVFHCTNCDQGHRVVWTGSDFVMQLLPTDFGVPAQPQ